MPNTYNEAEDIMLAFINAAWSTHAPTGAPLKWENIDAARPKVPQFWGRAVMRNTPDGYAAIGTSLLRRPATLFVQLFVPQGEGTKRINQLANALVVALQKATPSDLPGIRIRGLGATELGPDGTYFQVNVTASIEYDSIA